MSSTPDLESQVNATRADLASTLDAIGDKLDVPKRVSELGKRAQSSYEENPVPWIVAASAVAVGIVGLVAWALLSDDD